MKARVFVVLKRTVLDAQGQTIRAALNAHGHPAISDVRAGKYFDIQLSPEISREQAASQIEQIARDVLSNPVIEDYRFELLD